MSWLDKFIEKISFPGWVVHPYILFGVFVLLVFGAGFLTGSLLT